jgi:hypothetical protein
MTDDEAWSLIEVAMASFNAGTLQYVTCDAPFVTRIRSNRQDTELAKYHRGAYRGARKKRKALCRIMRHQRAKYAHIVVPQVTQIRP